MDDVQKGVRAFHKKFNAPAPSRTTDLSEYRGELRIALLREEVEEFVEAWELRDQVGMLDAIADIIFVANGAAVEMGVDLEPYHQEVLRTNLAKEGSTTDQIGKITKPVGWEPPRLAEILDQQRSKGDFLTEGDEPTLAVRLA